MFDPDGYLSDVDFPVGGRTVQHAALLLIQRLLNRLRPADAGRPAAGGRLVIGVPIPDGLIESELAALAERHRRIWATRYVEAPGLLCQDVLDMMCRMRLIVPAGPTRADTDEDPDGTDRQVTDVREARGRGSGWVLLAAAARYAMAEGGSGA